MNIKLFIFEVLVLYFLAVFQISFLVHFKPSLNLVLIAVVLINFLNKPTKIWGYESGLVGGFFMDIFSKSFFPFSTLILLTLTFLIKKTLEFLKLTSSPSLFFVFFVTLFISSIFYDFLLNLFLRMI